MAETTKIEWCDATVNFWWGCTKVSPACRSCYAESLAGRWGKDVWGAGKPREDHRPGARKLALKLERQAVREGRRLRVFCASMADWLDDEVPAEWLADLLALVAETPHLDWLLLSKRPHLWRSRLAAAHAHATGGMEYESTEGSWIEAWLNGTPPENVWVGTTVEDQERADERIPALLAIPARVRFLSCEPLLGPVDLGEWIGRIDHCASCGSENPTQKQDLCPRPQCVNPEGNLISTWGEEQHEDYRTGERYTEGSGAEDGPQIHWIIAGGESGAGARPSHPDWFRSLRDQAQAAGVAFHFKQWGEHAPIDGRPEEDDPAVDLHPRGITPDGRISTFTHMRRVGKAAAGRELDGRTWNELPEVTR